MRSVVSPKCGRLPETMPFDPESTTRFVVRRIRRDLWGVSSQLDTLDEMIEDGFPVPQFVKIDTEGHEFDVLRGAERYLALPSTGAIGRDARYHASELDYESPERPALRYGLRLFRLRPSLEARPGDRARHISLLQNRRCSPRVVRRERMDQTMACRVSPINSVPCWRFQAQS